MPPDDQSWAQHIEGYHRWYYDHRIWEHVSFLGVPCLKSVSDLWNYQEILYERRPSLVVEFGTYLGGSALFFSHVLRAISPDTRVLTIDMAPGRVDERVRCNPHIQVLGLGTTQDEVTWHIVRARKEYPGLIFAILDSDHQAQHVLAEMILLRSVLTPGDYLVVEDGNINGHPVCRGWGDGPFEAIEEYERRFPNDYAHDLQREHKFGFTFAPGGFLVRIA